VTADVNHRQGSRQWKKVQKTRYTDCHMIWMPGNVHRMVAKVSEMHNGS